MSIEQAKAFLTKVATDNSFKTSLIACKTADDRVKFAKNSGFNFTPEEIKQVKTELTDDELDAVAGGSCCGRDCENDVAGFCYFSG